MLYGAAAARDARAARRPADRAPPRVRRGDRQHGRVGASAPAGLIDAGARWRCSPPSPPAARSGTPAAGRSRCASDDQGREAHVGYAGEGVQRLRAHGPHRRAARRAVARAAEKRTASRRERRRGLDARRRRPGRGGRGLQRRPRLGVVLGRPAVQPGRGPRRGARAADRHDRRGGARRPAPTSRSTSCRRSRRAARARTDPAALALAALRRGGRGRRARRSSCARACSTPAGTRSSASPPSPTAAGGSTSPTAPASTSTRRPCAAAPRSTRCAARALG